jgi:hypothetical protein
MAMGRVFVFLMALFVLGFPAVTSAQEELSSTELRALSKSAANKQARHDLLSILKPMEQYPTGNRRQVGDIWLTTKAYGTQIPGICARDLLSLYYAPTEPGRATEDVPVRPYKVKASTSYTFVRPPSAKMLRNSDKAEAYRMPWQSECSKAPEDDFLGWFDADEPEFAVRGFLALQVAVARVKAGTLMPKSCADPLVESQKTCLEGVAMLGTDPDQLDSVKRCKADVGMDCFAIDAHWMDITIIAKQVEGVVAAEDIISFDAQQYIIVT